MRPRTTLDAGSLLLTCVFVRQGSVHPPQDGRQVGQHLCLAKNESRPQDSRRLNTQDGCRGQANDLGSAADASVAALSADPATSLTRPFLELPQRVLQ